MKKGIYCVFPAKRFRTFWQICNKTYYSRYANRQTNASQPCPQSFSHFFRDEMEPLHHLHKHRTKECFFIFPSCGRVQIILKMGKTSTRANKRGLLIYFIQIHQKRKYTRNYAWIILAWKRRKFTKAFIFIVRVIIVFRKWQISQFHSHFASYEQRLAAQITHWKTKKICDYPATPDSPVLKESLI